MEIIVVCRQEVNLIQTDRSLLNKNVRVHENRVILSSCMVVGHSR